MIKSNRNIDLWYKGVGGVIIGRPTEKCNISGQNIRRLREQKKLSQDQLAAKLQTEGLGVNQNSISRIETGKRIVTDFELKILSKVLNVDINELVPDESLSR